VVTKSEQNLADLEFILNELAAVSALSIDELKLRLEKHPEDTLHHIRLSDGSLRISTAAISKRFQNIALRKSESDAENDSYDLNSFITNLKSQFALIFLEHQHPLSRKTSDRMIDKALTKLKSERETITHFIPCEFLYKQEPKKFELGPVTFHTVEGFLEQYGEKIQDEIAKKKEQIEERWQNREEGEGKFVFQKKWTLKDALRTEDKLNKKFEHFFHELGWVAEVTVPKCLPEVSFSKAKEVVKAALDFMKLLLGERSGRRFRIAYDEGQSPETATLSLNQETQLQFGWSFGGFGAVSWDNWFEEVQDKFYMEMKLAGVTIRQLIDTMPRAPLSEKWLGALLWYGQGVSESSDSAKIVKYVAALEQLTITKKKTEDEISKTVISRTEFLCDEILEQDQTGETLTVIKNMYKYRSELLHGQISPSNKKIRLTASSAGRVTQQALFRALHFFVWLSTDGRDSLDELEKEYVSRTLKKGSNV